MQLAVNEAGARQRAQLFADVDNLKLAERKNGEIIDIMLKSIDVMTKVDHGLIDKVNGLNKRIDVLNKRIRLLEQDNGKAKGTTH